VLGWAPSTGGCGREKTRARRYYDDDGDGDHHTADNTNSPVKTIVVTAGTPRPIRTRPAARSQPTSSDRGYRVRLQYDNDTYARAGNYVI